MVRLHNYAVEPRYYGHHWGQKKCPCYGVSLLSGLILKKMYGVGQTKLSVITSVRIKQVSIKQGSTVPNWSICIFS